MMRFGSGTYNVRDSEVVRDAGRMSQRSLTCTVHFLDGSQEDFELDKHVRGQELLERVYEHLELIEKDYFGLQYADLVPEPDNMRWLEPTKSIRRQMQCPPYVLYFRVKFYVSDPSKLQEEYTRYHFYLQIRHDIHIGRLMCPESSAALLGSYAVQSQFGDYCDEEHGDHYLDAFQFLRNQTASLIKKIMELHKLHRGQTPADAEFNFLDHAKRLDMYGVDLYHARDVNLAEIQLGVTSCGVVVFQHNTKINTFSWAKILKISFKRKQFFIQLKADEDEYVETIVGFNLTSTEASKMLWKSCIEHHTFFRLIAPPQAAPKGLFSLGSRYRYSGRTEYQTLEDMKRKARIERTFHRTGSRFSYARSTIGPSCRDAILSSDRHLSSALGTASESGYNTAATVMTTTFGPSGSATISGKRNAVLPFSREHNGHDGVVVNGIRHRTDSATVATQSQVQQPSSSNNYVYQLSSNNGIVPSSSASSSSNSFNGANCSVSTIVNNNNNNNNSGTAVENGTYRLLPSPTNRSAASRQHSRTSNQSGNGALGRETTFGSTIITSKVLDAVDDVLVGEQSFEFPHETHANQQQTMAYSSIQRQPPNFHISRLTNGRATVGGGSPKHQAPPPAYPRSASPVVVTTAKNGYNNGHAAAPGTSNGSQRSSTASRSSLASTNGTSPQHRPVLPNGNGSISNGTGSPKRNSPVVVAVVNGYQQGHHNGHHVSENGEPTTTSGANLVTIRMKPDAQGRFGFNVKGGSDQNYPIIVSRVIPGSPADTCLPRLNEGDQVMFINSRDVSQHTHDQVVRFIRSCREAHTGELMLVVRPNAYEGEDVDEPEFQYVPQTPHVSECVPRSDKLHQSILLLNDNLASGSAIMQFEQLYRKKPGLTMDIARIVENINKNRYRDISPYDSTRVVIKNSYGSGGDYINASFVNMEIPTSGIVNRYIAAQGPLPQTTVDFWQIVWEQLCPTVVMLTATVERGRVKCHQYWPQLYETQDYGRLQITCLREKETPVGATREFSLVNQETKEERLVTQMQYVAWPDHGVPEDPKQFIEFVSQVRQSRAGMVEPMLVHCSAGIGRTGVLILMESAMCLIEANEPIYPLDVVRAMRDQRAMLIQTSSQYKFVCEAIVKVFNEGFVKPLAEYQQQQQQSR